MFTNVMSWNLEKVEYENYHLRERENINKQLKRFQDRTHYHEEKMYK